VSSRSPRSFLRGIGSYGAGPTAVAELRPRLLGVAVVLHTRAISAIDVRPCLTLSRPSSLSRRMPWTTANLEDLVGRAPLQRERADLALTVITS